jgi:hypothetical protein
MGVCSTCLTAIRDLGPHKWPTKETSKLMITLPKYDIKEVLDCWICTKFSEWLKSEDETAFAEWHVKGLEVEYFCFGRIDAENILQEDSLPLFLVRISHQSYNKDNGCSIELNFVSSQGENFFRRIFSSLRNEKVLTPVFRI